MLCPARWIGKRPWVIETLAASGYDFLSFASLSDKSRSCRGSTSAGDAAVRRSAQPKGAQQMSEHRLLIFRADAERLEHFLLQFRLVNSNAAAADLDAVQ